MKAWLAGNQAALVAETKRRHEQAQAKWLKEEAEKLAVQQERQNAEKAAAKALKEAAGHA
ncbi:MAG: hypothetical protein U1D68_11110 [Arthrobacter sp.]|nr:hypothetical protein [Arthrobacter sp.]MDZ4354021.1 hypothetical protein [Arthrobacter sp.]